MSPHTADPAALKPHTNDRPQCGTVAPRAPGTPTGSGSRSDRRRLVQIWAWSRPSSAHRQLRFIPHFY